MDLGCDCTMMRQCSLIGYETVLTSWIRGYQDASVITDKPAMGAGAAAEAAQEKVASPAYASTVVVLRAGWPVWY